MGLAACAEAPPRVKRLGYPKGCAVTRRLTLNEGFLFMLAYGCVFEISARRMRSRYIKRGIYFGRI